MCHCELLGFSSYAFCTMLVLAPKSKTTVFCFCFLVLVFLTVSPRRPAWALLSLPTLPHFLFSPLLTPYSSVLILSTSGLKFNYFSFVHSFIHSFNKIYQVTHALDHLCTFDCIDSSSKVCLKSRS